MWNSKVREWVDNADIDKGGKMSTKGRVLMSSMFLALCAFWIIIDFYAIPPSRLPFFPEHMCFAFLDETACPIDGTDQCGPCNGQACPCPCPGGVCPDMGVVGPCPQGVDEEPAEGYGNPASVGGPVCETLQVSPGDLGPNAIQLDEPRLCPTGIAPGTNISMMPPVFQQLSAADYCKTVCPNNMCGKGTPQPHQKIFLTVVKIIDDVFMAGGCVYAFIRGNQLKALPNSPLKDKARNIYLMLCFQLLTWWPHVRIHGWSSSPSTISALDIVFHAPVGISSIFLLKYTELTTLAASNYEWPLQKISYRQVQMIASLILGVVSFLVGMFVFNGCAWQNLPILGLPAGTFLAIMTSIVYFIEAMMFGCAVVFAVMITPVVMKLKQKSFKPQCTLLMVAFIFNVGNWFPHITSHNTFPLPWSVDAYVAMEFTWHWPILIFTFVIAFYANVLVKMALLSAKSEAARKNTSKTGSSKGTAGSSQRKSSGRSAPGGSHGASVPGSVNSNHSAVDNSKMDSQAPLISDKA